jgi:aspartate kinase
MMTVAKFGGSSVANAECMLRSAAIVASRPKIKVVVISATENTTNILEQLASLAVAKNQDELTLLFSQNQKRHLAIALELAASQIIFSQLMAIFDEAESMLKGISFLQECSAKSMDALYAIGERLSSLLFSVALAKVSNQQVVLKDVRQVMITNSSFGRAKPLEDLLKTKIEELWQSEIENNNVLIVTQGFIGATVSGDTTILGREGSDYSATLIADALDAAGIEIWKDVPGVATADPDTIKNVKFIPELSYAEMRDLSTLGAKVLHPMTLAPAEKKEIPVYIGSSFNQALPGTWIKFECQSRPLVQALTIKEEQTLVTLSALRCESLMDFYTQFFQLCQRHAFSLDWLHIHEAKISFLLGPREKIPNECEIEFLKLATIKRELNTALVSLVGHGLRAKKGFMSELFSLAENESIRLVHFGTSVHAFSLLVEQKNGLPLLQKLHAHFFEDNL